MTEFERQVLELADVRFPHPQIFDIDSCADPERAEKFWRDMENRGFVEIHDLGKCGAERIPGKFVSLSKATRSALAAVRPEND